VFLKAVVVIFFAIDADILIHSKKKVDSGFQMMALLRFLALKLVELFTSKQRGSNFCFK